MQDDLTTNHREYASVRAHLYTPPLLVPVPCFDRHVITSSKHNARSGVNGQAANVVGVCFKSSYLLMSVVVEDS